MYTGETMNLFYKRVLIYTWCCKYRPTRSVRTSQEVNIHCALTTLSTKLKINWVTMAPASSTLPVTMVLFLRDYIPWTSHLYPPSHKLYYLIFTNCTVFFFPRFTSMLFSYGSRQSPHLVLFSPSSFCVYILRLLRHRKTNYFFHSSPSPLMFATRTYITVHTN